MTSFLYKDEDKTGIITGISSGFNAFSSVGVGMGGAGVVHFPNSSVLKTEDGDSIKCNVTGDAFKLFEERIAQTRNQIKALDVSQPGLNRMRTAYEDPEKWAAFLDEHAPVQ